MPPVVMIHGTDGLKKSSPWWRAASPFSAMLLAHGLTIVEPRPKWSGALGGTRLSPPADYLDPWAADSRLTIWADAAEKLLLHLDKYAPGVPLNAISHSHGGNVLVFAILYAEPGRFHDVVTVSTPVVNTMIEHRLAALKKITGRHLHFYDTTDMVQAEGCLDDGLYPIRLTRTWPEPAQSVEVPGNGHSNMLNVDPEMFVRAGGATFLQAA